MEYIIIVILAIVLLIIFLAGFTIGKNKGVGILHKYNNMQLEISKLNKEKQDIINEKDVIKSECKDMEIQKEDYQKKICEENNKKEQELILSIERLNKDIESKTFLIREKVQKDEELEKHIEKSKNELESTKKELSEILHIKEQETELREKVIFWNAELEEKTPLIEEIRSRCDLYSRIDDFTYQGIYEKPDYLYETSIDFSNKIKLIQDDQKNMIKDDKAVISENKSLISEFTELDNNFVKKLKKLMLKAYNIECERLINKVTIANFTRTLKQITTLANNIENLSPALDIYFNNGYIKLKLFECKLLYQYKLKQKDEKEAKELEKEQIKAEAEFRKEYIKATKKAEEKENLLQELIDNMKKRLEYSEDKEKEQYKMQILSLEEQLEEAKEATQRAKSMAEQTRKGYVYVISNIGSFGKNVYKIGMTRRLDPMDRVKELGDASVPFKFDVHALIYCEDAPAVEHKLHKYFSNSRVNAVNYRKEFFSTSLVEIKKVLDEVIGEDYEFNANISANEFYESERLKAV